MEKIHPSDLEPAERDPAKMRRTALTLIIVMLVGAFFVLLAYKRHEAKQNPDRPPITAMISKNLAAKNQDGKLVSLLDYKGRVWFVAPICVSQLDENKHALAMMQELEEKYRDNENVGFALISIEGADQGVGPEQLTEAAEELGFDSSRVGLLTTGSTADLRGFIKKQLRLGIVSERAEEKEGEEGGKWKFPSQIALVDQGMHLRQRYDFKEAHQYQARAELDLAESPSLKNEEKFEDYLFAVEKLKNTLYTNTDHVLKEVSVGATE